MAVQNPEFKILDCQNPEFKILAVQNPLFKILDRQNPAFKMDEASDLANDQGNITQSPSSFTQHDVNKKGWPNTTRSFVPFVHLPFIFRSFKLFCRFTLVYEGHFVLCYKEKTRAVRASSLPMFPFAVNSSVFSISVNASPICISKFKLNLKHMAVQVRP